MFIYHRWPGPCQVDYKSRENGLSTVCLSDCLGIAIVYGLSVTSFIQRGFISLQSVWLSGIACLQFFCNQLFAERVNQSRVCLSDCPGIAIVYGLSVTSFIQRGFISLQSVWLSGIACLQFFCNQLYAERVNQSRVCLSDCPGIACLLVVCNQL